MELKVYNSAVKGRIVPVGAQRHIGVEVDLHSFLTLATERVSGQLHATVSLSRGIRPPVPTEQDTGWAPEKIWKLLRSNEFLAPVRDQNPSFLYVQPVVCSLH